MMEHEIAVGRVRTILRDLSRRVSQAMERCKFSSLNGGASMNLIEILRQLECIVEDRMRTSPGEERERASDLAFAVVNGRRAEEEAQDLRKLLEMMRMKHRASVDEIAGKIEEERQLLEGIKRQRGEEVDERMKRLEEATRGIENVALIEKKQIEEEIRANGIEQQRNCVENSMRERVLYAERKRAEHRYLEILARYDRDVGELHRTMESLIKETNLLSSKLKHLEETLGTQEIQYVELRTERETAIRRVFLENLRNFMRNRGAKIIQRTWRAYWERQQLRKKKKGKKKRQ